MKLTQSTIQSIESSLEKRIPLEIRVEKGNVVLVELKRKVKSKAPYTN